MGGVRAPWDELSRGRRGTDVPPEGRARAYTGGRRPAPDPTAAPAAPEVRIL